MVNNPSTIHTPPFHPNQGPPPLIPFKLVIPLSTPYTPPLRLLQQQNQHKYQSHFNVGSLTITLFFTFFFCPHPSLLISPHDTPLTHSPLYQPIVHILTPSEDEPTTNQIKSNHYTIKNTIPLHIIILYSTGVYRQFF